MKEILQTIIPGLSIFLLCMPPLFGALESSIDWKKGVLIGREMASIHFSEKGTPVDSVSLRQTSLNRARMNAYDRAREKALQQILNLAQDVPVENGVLLEEYLERDNSLVPRLNRTIEEYARFVHSPADFKSVSCRVSLRIQDLIPVFPFHYDERPFPMPADLALATRYSSLVIDARGLDIRPMLFPAVLNEDGREIYGRRYIRLDKALEHGIVTYVHSESEADNHPLRGERPYFTAALRGVKGNPVISHQDVRRIFSSPETRKSLKNCKVIFIVNRK
jgi:hypothetical protein